MSAMPPVRFGGRRKALRTQFTDKTKQRQPRISPRLFFYLDSLIRRYSFSIKRTCEEKSLSLSAASFSIVFNRLLSMRIVLIVDSCITSPCTVIPPFDRLYPAFIFFVNYLLTYTVIHGNMWL